MSLFEHELGRQVLGLEWLDDHELRLLLAPPDDWQDHAARVEDHVASVRRDDWRSVAPASIEPEELAGPRIPMPRLDSRAQARAAVSRLSPDAEPRRMSAAIDGRPLESGELLRLFPYSWVPGETHFPGPGIEAEDGSLIYSGTVYDGRGLQPGGAFVIRRDMTTGNPLWTVRTDYSVVDLDADADTAYVAYRDGEILALCLEDGSVRQRWRLRGISPTALTVTGAGRLLVGTSDGRTLDCRFALEGS